MTREEARELLQTTPIDIRSPRDDLSPADYFEALNMAIEALEKQIPKKVVKVKLRESEWGVPWRCPLCEADIAKVEFMRDDGFEPKEKVSYCWHCGQAIDWSEE